MRPADFDGSWQRSVGPQVVAFAAGAQLAAAQAATAYVPAILGETGQPDEPLARVRPQAFAGVASDGRPLDTLLEGSVRHAKAQVALGVAADGALSYGLRWLEGALQTVATDAARDAVAAEVMVRERMGWVRAVNPPCCSRCAVLAGRWYSWKADFARHPRCDCFAIPSLENRAGDFTTDTRLLVDRGMVTDLTRAQRQRLNEGADLSRVLNESRDRWRARLAEQRRADKRRVARQSPIPASEQRAPSTTSIHDFMQHLTDRVSALGELRRAGIAE